MKSWHLVIPLAAAISFSAGAADIPKEGSYKGIYSAIGSERVDNIGNDRLLNTFDEFAFQVTKWIPEPHKLEMLGRWRLHNRFWWRTGAVCWYGC